MIVKYRTRLIDLPKTFFIELNLQSYAFVAQSKTLKNYEMCFASFRLQKHMIAAGN